MRSSRMRPCHRRPGLSRSRRGVLVLVLLLGLAIVVAGWRDGAAVLDGVDYDRMSIVPVGCVSRNGKSDAIEFEFYKGRGRPFFGRRRRGAVGGTSYVATIAHYMRAHFNRMALDRGGDGNFTLPRDVGFLNVSGWQFSPFLGSMYVVVSRRPLRTNDGFGRSRLTTPPPSPSVARVDVPVRLAGGDRRLRPAPLREDRVPA